MSGHEDLSRTNAAKPTGNRAFGWVFTVALLVIGLWPLVAHEPVRWWALVVSAVFLVLTLAAPRLLALPNRLWQKFGALLHRIVSPIVLFILFYVVVTPMGMLMRTLSGSGRRWRSNRGAGSYWIARQPPGPDPDSLRNQF